MKLKYTPYDKPKVLIGADPELFVRQNGEFISGDGLIKGTKQEPCKVKNGAVQVDGMALEFNIDPAATLEQFHFNLNAVKGQLQGMIGKDKELVSIPTAHFSQEIMDSQSLKALELGCEPDFNAWKGGEVNPTPDATNKNFRTGAGHIHIGWGKDIDINDPDHIEACCTMVRALDVVLYPLSLLWDSDNERRDLYGNLGAFRPKSYGVEYRVLSNAWVDNLLARDIIWHVVQHTFNYLVNNHDFTAYPTSSKMVNRVLFNQISMIRPYKPNSEIFFGKRWLNWELRSAIENVIDTLRTTPVKKVEPAKTISDDIHFTTNGSEVSLSGFWEQPLYWEQPAEQAVREVREARDNILEEIARREQERERARAQRDALVAEVDVE